VRRIRHEPDAVLVAHVEAERDDAAAERLDLALERAEPLDVAAGDDQVGPGARQRPCEPLPESAAGAGDDRDPAREIEQRLAQNPTPFAFRRTRIR
jgi:hypothetical protein